MIYVYVVVGILAAGFLGLMIFANKFYKIAAFPNKVPYEKICANNLEKNQYSESYLEALDKEYFMIDANADYQLHCMWIANGDSQKTIILSHGITVCMAEVYRYIQYYYDSGFNVFMVDHRYHGKSGGINASFGYHEKHDMVKCVDWVLEKVGKDSVVGTHGESMGAAIILQHAAIDNRVSFVVADCPYESVISQFAYRLKVEYKLPSFPIVNLASLINKLNGNGFYGEIAPVKIVNQIEMPVLFIHGEADEYIPVSHCHNLYDNKTNGMKEKYIAKGADHVESFIVDVDKYHSVLDEFIGKVGIA